ncbi:MAG: hypothetical protein BWY45_02640 [Euryarchaeota archaeon ADurb.Bin294]|nr:MAG: hypothetical protein BWY45_02640 [Euryarchaeota archaeon ADurb.Bin294]
MDKGIDDNLPEHGERNTPDIFSSDLREICTSHGMFLQKQDDALHRIRKGIINVDMVKDICLVSSDKPATLDPCIGKVKITSFSIKKHGAMRGNIFSLIQNQQFKGHEFLSGQFPFP